MGVYDALKGGFEIECSGEKGRWVEVCEDGPASSS